MLLARFVGPRGVGIRTTVSALASLEDGAVRRRFWCEAMLAGSCRSFGEGGAMRKRVLCADERECCKQ